jgi:hypothetical protein
MRFFGQCEACPPDDLLDAPRLMDGFGYVFPYAYDFVIHRKNPTKYLSHRINYG